MKRSIAMIMVFAISLLVIGCGKTNDKIIGSTEEKTSTIIESDAGETTDQKNEADSLEITTYAGEQYQLIEDQSFTFDFMPFGQATFKSYAPYQVDGNRDALFEVVKDDMVVALNDPREAAATQDFGSIEAISFPDLNDDGYDDVIIIMTYYNLGGPDAGSDYQWAKLFVGSRTGEFIEDQDFEMAINNSVSEYTVANIKNAALENISMLDQNKVMDAIIIECPKDFELYRTYTLDRAQTEAHMSGDVTLFSMFGTGLGSYGASLEINNDNTFSYYIGIGATWEGTLRIESGKYYLDITADTQEGGHDAETKEILFKEVNGEVYLTFEQYDEMMFWK
ncbi:MAG TPA: hypothetical protein VJY54_06150 [Lachnospiraceae bacterium]|nr:hypothetical protein [Lachnospiraceae bacterium]